MNRFSMQRLDSFAMGRLRGDSDMRSFRFCGLKSTLHCAVRIAVCAPMILSTVGYSEVVCKLPENAVSISQPGASQTPVEVHVDSFGWESKTVRGVFHLDLRNDGPTQPTELCASPYLRDIKDNAQTVKIAVALAGNGKPTSGFDSTRSCLTLPNAWQAAQSKSFDLYFETNSEAIPLSGFVLLDSSVSATEVQPAPGAATGKAPCKQSFSHCVSHAKPLTRSVILLPSNNPSWLNLPLYGALGAAVLYLLISVVWLFKRLGKPMGGPQWGFGTSFATNFTVGTGLLSLVLGGTVISDALHYLTKTHYVLLGLLFATLLLVAPAFFTFFSKRQKFPSPSGPPVIAAVGWVWLYVLS